MKHCEKERAIACIRLAIELAGDGGMTPFTDVECQLHLPEGRCLCKNF